MMERESSDEEEDLEALIDPNPGDGKSTHRRNAPSSFEIGHVKGRFGLRFNHRCRFRKWYLVAVILPPLLLALYFLVDLRRLVRGSSSSGAGIGGSFEERMREAELRALYLLRNQHLRLRSAWNRSLSYGEGFNSSSSNLSSHAAAVPSRLWFDEIRSALLDQIKLNMEIQQSLLSSHQVGNVSELVDDNLVAQFSVDTCKKVQPFSGRRTVEWKPNANRYLFAICVSGQMSNHLICLEKHMFFAALLNRVLVLPSPKFDYDYERVLDIENMNKCFGRKVVITFDEFVELKKGHLHIDRFICYVAVPPCYVDEGHLKKLKSLGLSMGKIEAAWPKDGKPDQPKNRTVEDMLPKFSSDVEVLAIGDMFFASVEEEWVMQPGGSLAHSCKSVIQPSRLIILTAQRFIQTFLGGKFIALHFRRHGFLNFCNVKKESCFFPIPQAADCILRLVEKTNAPVIYLSTDAAESETDLLQSLVVLNGKPVPLVKRPKHNSAEKWDAYLYRNHIAEDDQVEAMLDKTICAMSNVFIGARGSTFTEDILRLRKDWGSASVCDEYLCRGEQPNFIAEPE